MDKRIGFLLSYLAAMNIAFPEAIKTLYAAPTEADMAMSLTTKNYASNPGAENGKAGWSVSGTSASMSNLTVTSAAADKYEGNGGFSWTPANADNYLSNAAVTITSAGGLSGTDCAAIIWTKTTATDYALEVYDGSTVVNSVLIPSSAVFLPTTINWRCSGSGTNLVRLNPGSTTTIYFDSLKWGDARGINLNKVAQAYWAGSIEWAACTNCQWSISQTTFAANFTADNDFGNPTVAGIVLAPTTKVPAFRLAGGSGYYLFELEGALYKLNSTADFAEFRFYDGTTGTVPHPVYASSNQTVAGGMTGGINYTVAPVSTNEIHIQGRQSGASTSVALHAGVTGYGALKVNVFYFPTVSQTIHTPATAALAWQGTVSGSGTTNSTSGSGVALSGSAPTVANISTTNLVCVAGAAAQSISCPLPKAGTYKVCADGYTSSGSTGQTIRTWLAAASATIGNPQIGNFANTYNGVINICRDYVAAGAGSVQFQIFGSVDTGTGTWTIGTWNVTAITTGVPAPVYQSSITSNGNATERHESAAVTSTCSSSPCTIASQSGSWLTSITRNGPGDFTGNIATGMFSGPVRCVVLSTQFHTFYAGTATATTFSWGTANSSHSVADPTQMMIHCMGPR